MSRMKQNMGLNGLLKSAFPQASALSNATDSMPVFSPTTLLETFVPGYSAIHKFLLYSLGIDVTVLVSLGVVLYLALRLFRSLYSTFESILATYYTSEITVSSTDEIHIHLISFLAHTSKSISSRRLMAETPTKSAWEVDSEEPAEQLPSTPETGIIKYLNFSNQEAKSHPRFTPAIGSHNFWHSNNYFRLKRSNVSIFDELGNGGGAFKEKELLTLSCYGRSPKPIKNLLQVAKTHYHQGHNAKTVIKRPAPKDMRRFGHRGLWLQIAERPCRPMGTVVLDDKRKMDVLNDINEYLNPATARWYANRGIPYRRGYLFYGPPGTGKTSLTFALAGVFGLDIHVISLLEPTLTEEDLGLLFMQLPARCIVLLEDIDTAGLVRDETSEDKEEGGNDGSAGGNGNEMNVVNLTKALKKVNQMSGMVEEKKGISLSGLLNIIDGVASHEGRVLVMTTNHPEKLDAALIRPGRVDHQVSFSNATQHQIKELFERMYSIDLPSTTTLSKPHLENNTNSNSFLHSPLTTTTNIKNPEIQIKGEITPPPTPIFKTEKQNHNTEKDETTTINENELKVLASEFATRIPNDMFSPAEIQGFLLTRKKDPRKAVEEISGWVGEMIEVMRGGGKFRG